MIRNILVGYDGSEPAGKAFAYGLDLANKYAAQAELESAEEHFREQFEGMKQRAIASGLAVRFEVLVGHPAERIVEFAEKNHIDFIALGSRGRNRFRRWALGSVSERVTAYAHCPVAVVR